MMSFRVKMAVVAVVLAAIMLGILLLILLVFTDLGSRHITIVMISLVIGMAFFGTGMSFFESRLLGKNTAPVIDFARRISQGDLRETIDAGEVELLGMVAEAQNHMVEGLQKIIGSVREAAVHVGAVVEELAAGSQEVNAATQEFSATIQQVSLGTQTQATNVEKMVLLINEIATMAVDVAERAHGAVETSLRANRIAQEGSRSAETSAERMIRLQQAVEEATGIIRSLGDRSQQIGLIVDVITNIANQTNMLALNAAIEASRAGEHGRGFAVVAEEVRGLAEGSKRAADQIAKMVRDTENETGRVVKVMEASQETVTGSIQVISETLDSLRDVAEVVNEMAGVVDSISNAAERQKEAATRVARTSEDIATVADESAASTQEASATAEEQSASMQEMTASIQELAEVSEKLREAVAEFKI
jgi:methyl-accepting chemotaxis protein